SLRPMLQWTRRGNATGHHHWSTRERSMSNRWWNPTRDARHARNVLLGMLVLAAAGCAAAPAPRTHEVRVTDDGGTFRFEPANVEARVGDVVRFVYDGTMPHNV